MFNPMTLNLELYLTLISRVFLFGDSAIELQSLVKRIITLNHFMLKKIS